MLNSQSPADDQLLSVSKVKATAWTHHKDLRAAISPVGVGPKDSVPSFELLNKQKITFQFFACMRPERLTPGPLPRLKS